MGNEPSGLPPAVKAWIEARKRYHLSHAQVQMARELGMNPQKFGKLANDRQEPWKAPLPQYIEYLYLKRFGRERPEIVLPAEKWRRPATKQKPARNGAKRVPTRVESEQP
jgi:hypothetical protein